MAWQTALCFGSSVFFSSASAGFAAAFHRQFGEGVARSGRRRRAENLDVRLRQRRIDVAPRFIRVGLEAARAVGMSLASAR